MCFPLFIFWYVHWTSTMGAKKKEQDTTKLDFGVLKLMLTTLMLDLLTQMLREDYSSVVSLDAMAFMTESP